MTEPLQQIIDTLEQIPVEWDGFTVDVVAEGDVDVGEALRRQLAPLLTLARSLQQTSVQEQSLDARDANPALHEVLEFLYGAAPMDGVWFGDVPEGKPRYWWRSKLRAALQPQEGGNT